MSDAATPPPPGPSSSAPTSIKGHTTNMVRNVVVSVTSTVLGATLVYFLGFNHKSDKSSGNDYLVTKEATTKAWRSYVTVENIYYKNAESLKKELGQTGKFDDFKESLIHESDKFQKDLDEILKDDGIDKAFVTMMNRRKENEQSVEVKLKIYLNNLGAILKLNLGQDERKQKLNAEDAVWASYSKGVVERLITDIEDLAKTLGERYGQPFAMTDLLAYNSVKAEENKPDVNKPDVTTQETNTNVTNKPDKKDKKDYNIENVKDDKKTVPKDEKRGEQFTSDPDPETTVNVSKLIGDWQTNDRSAEIYLGKDGSLEWYVFSNNETASGTWRFYNKQLYMYATNNKSGQKATWIFNLSNVNANAFTMKLATTPFNIYYLKRIE